jgi:hypothetical protein
MKVIGSFPLEFPNAWYIFDPLTLSYTQTSNLEHRFDDIKRKIGKELKINVSEL